MAIGPFPAWLAAVAIAGFGVWAASQIDEAYGWMLAVLLLLSVLVVREGAADRLAEFARRIMATTPAPAPTRHGRVVRRVQ